MVINLICSEVLLPAFKMRMLIILRLTFPINLLLIRNMEIEATKAINPTIVRDIDIPKEIVQL
jgi:hypothetical protein